MSPTLRKSSPKDAAGKPLDSARLYRPLAPYGRIVNGAPCAYTEDHELRGDHEAVQLHPHLWVATDTPANEKATLRKARYQARMADLPPAPVDPWATRIAEQRRIPFERRVVATDAFNKGSTFVPRGAQRDVDDPIVRAAPEMFRDLNGEPLNRPDEAA